MGAPTANRPTTLLLGPIASLRGPAASLATYWRSPAATSSERSPPAGSACLHLRGDSSFASLPVWECSPSSTTAVINPSFACGTMLVNQANQGPLCGEARHNSATG